MNVESNPDVNKPRSDQKSSSKTGPPPQGQNAGFATQKQNQGPKVIQKDPDPEYYKTASGQFSGSDPLKPNPRQKDAEKASDKPAEQGDKGYGDKIKEEAKDKVIDTKEKAEDMKDKIKDKAGDMKDTIKDKSEDIKDKAGDVKDKMKDKAGDIKDKAGDMKDKIQDKAGDMKDTIK